MTMVYAPWTDDQVRSANDYQTEGCFHEFTSDKGEALIATKDGWVTEAGGPVVQTWAYLFMLDNSWRDFAISKYASKR